MLTKLSNHAFRIYYRVYYILIAKWMLAHPKTIIPRLTTQRMTPRISFGAEKHQSFLIAHYIDPRSVNRWLFWRYTFSYRKQNDAHWYKLPSLTPWLWMGNGDGTYYGLNSEFVKHHLPDVKKYEFCVWK